MNPPLRRLLALLPLFLPAWLSAGGIFTVLTYNVENLFDIDGVAPYDDYQPAKYTPGMLLRKVRAIAHTLGHNPGGTPEIVVLNEIEVDGTPESTVTDYRAFVAANRGRKLDDLLGGAEVPADARGWPAEAWLMLALAERGMGDYHVVAPPLAENTAIRVVILSKYPVRRAAVHPTEGARGILHAEIEVGGDALHILGLHWKSGASRWEDELTRHGNARVTRAVLDEILRADPAADVIITGDFNSHYNQRQIFHGKETALNDILGSQGDEEALLRDGPPALYNLWFELPPEERRSDLFRGRWGTLMQMIVTPGLYDGEGVQYVDNSFGPLLLPGHNVSRATGEPLSWRFTGGGGGTSDHFPVRARFVYSAGRPLQPTNPGREDTSTAPQPAHDYRRVDLSAVVDLSEAVRDEASLGAAIDQVVLVSGRVSSVDPLRVRVRDSDLVVVGGRPALAPLAAGPVGAPTHFFAILREGRNGLLLAVEHPKWVLRAGGQPTVP